MRKAFALDIDETICDTRRYWFAELSQRFGSPRAGSLDDLIAHYEYTTNVAEWQTPEARAWLSAARADDRIHRDLLAPIPGAVAAVAQLNERFDIVYMTMRPDSIVGPTRDWIRSQGFPVGEVVASPSCLFDGERPAWKGRELMGRYPQVVGLVDDHIDVANNIPVGYQGKLFLLGQPSAPRSDISIIPCADWSEVTRQVAIAFPRELTP